MQLNYGAKLRKIFDIRKFLDKKKRPEERFFYVHLETFLNTKIKSTCPKKGTHTP